MKVLQKKPQVTVYNKNLKTLAAQLVGDNVATDTQESLDEDIACVVVGTEEDDALSHQPDNT